MTENHHYGRALKREYPNCISPLPSHFQLLLPQGLSEIDSTQDVGSSVSWSHETGATNDPAEVSNNEIDSTGSSDLQMSTGHRGVDRIDGIARVMLKLQRYKQEELPLATGAWCSK